MKSESVMTLNGIDVPVVVVGAGPAGLTLAITVASYGIDCLVLERRPQMSSLPRATSLSLACPTRFPASA